MTGAERIIALDIIRGLAVLGILLANITAFANPDIAYYWPPALPGGDTAVDGWMWVAQYVLVDAKFRGMFTILLGAGMVLFVERSGTARQARRLVWLGVFGLAHYFLLFTGDVLFSYACGGLIALLAARWRARNLLAAGIMWALAGALLLVSETLPNAIIEVAAQTSPTAPEGWEGLQHYWAEQLADAEAQAAAATGDSLPALVAFRWTHESDGLAGALFYIFIETIPLALIGMGMMRAGVFTNAEIRRAAKWPAVAGVAAGLALNLALALYVRKQGFPPFLTMAAFFGLSSLFNLPLLLGASVLLTDWALAIRHGWLGERLALAGRMAFSNYLGTSLVMAVIFQGWAFGLYGTMHRGDLLVVVVFGWALMLTASRLWLARFRHGPLEWLWRCLTYWRLFPNRLA